MHTYRRCKGEELWTTGYLHNGQWYPLKDFSSEEKAAGYANYLNGGEGVGYFDA